MRALAVQLSTFTWLDKTIKGMGGSVSTLVDQQKASQSRMGNIEKVIPQPSGKITCPEKIVSQHSGSGSVIPKSVYPEEAILQQSGVSSDIPKSVHPEEAILQQSRVGSVIPKSGVIS